MMFFNGDVDELDELCTPNFAIHNPDMPWADDNGISWDGLTTVKNDYVAHMRIAYPDGKYTIEDILAEGDKVAVRVTFTGTYMGQPASDWTPPDNKRYQYEECAIFTFVDGKAAKAHWYRRERKEI